MLPAHPSPCAASSGAAVHAGEIAQSGNARARESGPGVGVRPSVTAVGGVVDFVGPVGAAANSAVTAAFVHAGDVHVARHLVTGDLHVANEGSGDFYRGVPRCTVISREGDFQSATAQH